MTTDLAKAMIARADQDGLPADHPMRVKAEEFDAVAIGYYDVPQTHDVKQFMGAWARARRAWSEYSGEPLI